MAADAGFRQTGASRHRLPMACRTFQILVCALERKGSAPSVIESPHVPSIRIVARRTVGAERPLVNVLGRMAGLAARVVQLKGVIPMARFAAAHPVQTEQRKGSQVVVERDAFDERVFPVTACTILPQLSAMDIVAPVASYTADVLDRLFGPWPRVTRHTRCVAMCASQCKFRLDAVVEANFGPFLGSMAVVAGSSESSCVHVLRRMASGASLGQLEFAGWLPVTRIAIRPAVRARQSEAALPFVIEALLPP
jgi:hypothetical protein